MYLVVNDVVQFVLLFSYIQGPFRVAPLFVGLVKLFMGKECFAENTVELPRFVSGSPIMTSCASSDIRVSCCYQLSFSILS